MPALYLADARLLHHRRCPQWLLGAWVALFLADAAALYPLRMLTGT
jgi:hypothetical protein